jgi:hypothetical protein
LIGIAVVQNGHDFVVGAAAEASSFRFMLLMPRMRRKIAKTMMMKLIIVLMNTPMFIVTAPAAFASTKDA